MQPKDTERRIWFSTLARYYNLILHNHGDCSDGWAMIVCVGHWTADTRVWEEWHVTRGHITHNYFPLIPVWCPSLGPAEIIHCHTLPHTHCMLTTFSSSDSSDTASSLGCIYNSDVTIVRRMKVQLQWRSKNGALLLWQSDKNKIFL